ncbi:peptide deformylase [Candidatus Falkowbacteria bacterium HGW-Falkowbacteria-1]|jgi:peptide deformylase|uniref:Peptide deformylase n=1 Tax=Candidatus Falkowbacteria bacterium HGW-Falkowbacteria-1 TaxID=2013768 RepID=A0A2N2EAB7_9BACT|nr:MAG: peptide deformylase [Candidatus Falkowbacteria bacterium HGW-Falkowbacteria-1]
MAELLEIIKHPNKILRIKSKEIDLEMTNNQSFIELAKNMEKTMLEKDGAGLAAPQVGKNIRLIVLSHKKKNIIMINPFISKKSWAKEIDLEGCLSVVDKQGEIYYKKVSRHKKVNCVYFDLSGKKNKISAEGLLSRAIQHEIDHLDGILFIDRAKE